ncbi:DUF4089 domain-containing protein [Acidithiobacillus ferrooxidans F221]|uniref:DUF4089 domain-containing protein n=1 Tax=Acidithiobacillus ferrooxidans TaxID=920 RepID=UPI001C07A844|nr:DUF4089 domain-containing protein [Acidithiobacillus ferrooxidans]MBU2807856.1 DUF4089 domain-containing protein [Acidithiobacillus ferrooxidans F221]
MNPPGIDAETPVDTYMNYIFDSLGLSVREEWRADVTHYFMLSARMAKVLEAYPLDMTEDLAPVFCP